MNNPDRAVGRADRQSGGIFRAMRSGTFKRLLKSRRFWVVQSIVIALAALHDILENAAFMAAWGNLYFLPVALFWLPIWYSGWSLGFAGSLLTAVSVVVFAIPNFLFWHQGSNRLAEISEVTVMACTGLLVGWLVDQSRAARLSAKLFAGHAVRALEEERRRISRDLHDQTIQGMVAVIRDLDRVRRFNRELPSPVSEELLNLRTQIEHIISELRGYIAATRPYVLNDLGVVACFRSLLDEFKERTGIAAGIEVIGEETNLGAGQKTNLYRLLQEALLNIERHAEARQVKLTLGFGHREAIVEIKDDGAGFTPRSLDRLAASGKFGLLGMNEYAELLGGRLQVDSAPGAGTRISVTVPLKKDTGW